MTYKKDREIKIGNTLIGDYHDLNLHLKLCKPLVVFDRMKNMINYHMKLELIFLNFKLTKQKQDMI